MNGIILQGSSRSDGNTAKVVAVLQKRTGFDVVDLLQKRIGHYDYAYQNQDDDFLPLIRDIVEKYDVIIFATPVYWYSMSGIMKAFFDRLSDLIRIEKPTGRKLRGKKMAMVSCSGDENLVAGYAMPFIESAKYLGMTYVGDVHAWVEEGEQVSDEVRERIRNFAEKIKQLSEL